MTIENVLTELVGFLNDNEKLSITKLRAEIGINIEIETFLQTGLIEHSKFGYITSKKSLKYIPYHKNNNPNEIKIFIANHRKNI